MKHARSPTRLSPTDIVQYQSKDHVSRDLVKKERDMSLGVKSSNMESKAPIGADHLRKLSKSRIPFLSSHK